MTKAANLAASANATAGNVTATNIQSNATGTPTVFQDSAGTQVGTLCRAWVSFTGSTAAITASFNVSSVTRNSTGVYTVNFTNALADANYAFQLTSSNINGAAWGVGIDTNAPSTTALRFYTQAYNTNNFDPTYNCVAIFR